jgi:enoyl-CoA hydratase/carnithine racemase
MNQPVIITVVCYLGKLFKSTVVARQIDDVSTVFNPITGTFIPVSQAIHLGLIGRDKDTYYNPATNETMSIDEAIKRGLVTVSSAADRAKNRLSASDVVTATIDWQTGTIVERGTGRTVSVEEALRRGLIDETMARHLQDRTDENVPSKESSPAESVQITIRTTEVVEQPPRSITIEETVSGSSALESQSAGPVDGKLSFDAAVKLGLYNIRTGKFFNPATGQMMSLQEAVDAGLIGSKLPALVDLRTGQICSLLEAFDRQLINRTTGLLDKRKVAAARMTLDPRFLAETEEQIVMNMEDALACRLLDGETGKFTNPLTHQQMTLADAVASGQIAGDATVVLNPATGTRHSLTDALTTGLVDGRTGKMSMPADGKDNKEVTLREASSCGITVSAYSTDGSTVLNKQTGERVHLMWH